APDYHGGGREQVVDRRERDQPEREVAQGTKQVAGGGPEYAEPRLPRHLDVSAVAHRERRIDAAPVAQQPQRPTAGGQGDRRRRREGDPRRRPPRGEEENHYPASRGDADGAREQRQPRRHTGETRRRRRREARRRRISQNDRRRKQDAEQGREDERIQGRIVHGGRGPGEVRMHVSEAAAQRDREPGVETIVVKNAYQVVIQCDRAHHRDERGGERRRAAGGGGQGSQRPRQSPRG